MNKIIQCPNCGWIQLTMAVKTLKCRKCGKSKELKHVKIIKVINDPVAARVLIERLRQE
ncbi:MAG: hypothetical protein WC307_01350 [Candidatus Nanoarchaeia archaeon]|jgi:transcription elongation factor Elf1